MELRQPEAIGPLDDHHGGIGHVDPDLDDGRGEEDLRLARDEALHLGILLLGLHLAMHHHHLELREALAVAHHPLLQRTQLGLLLLLDHGEDDIGLPPLGDLLLEEAVDAEELALADVVGLYRLAPWRQLVDDGDIEVAVERHGERPRDGRGTHGEDMGVPRGVLRPQSRALHDAEAVLLVDDAEGEGVEVYAGLDEGMRPDEDGELARGQGSVQTGALAAACAADEEAHLEAEGLEQLRQRGVVLTREDLGRRHQAGLVAIVHRQQHGEEGHQRLAATHIALHEAVHLPPRDDVGLDLSEDALLRLCEIKG